MYPLLKVVIFHCHVSFLGELSLKFTQDQFFFLPWFKFWLVWLVSQWPGTGPWLFAAGYRRGDEQKLPSWLNPEPFVSPEPIRKSWMLHGNPLRVLVEWNGSTPKISPLCENGMIKDSIVNFGVKIYPFFWIPIIFRMGWPSPIPGLPSYPGTCEWISSLWREFTTWKLTPKHSLHIGGVAFWNSWISRKMSCPWDPSTLVSFRDFFSQKKSPWFQVTVNPKDPELKCLVEFLLMFCFFG